MIRLLTLLALLSPLLALAHEGHGHSQDSAGPPQAVLPPLGGGQGEALTWGPLLTSHWHATDVAMFVGVVLAVVVWLRARK